MNQHWGALGLELRLDGAHHCDAGGGKRKKNYGGIFAEDGFAMQSHHLE